MRFLADQFPALVDQYDRLYAAKYAPKDYSSQVQKTLAMLKVRYGLANRQKRETATAITPAESLAAQGVFEWTATTSATRESRRK
jgi:hypothetical protein